jgi:hypothetical protein
MRPETLKLVWERTGNTLELIGIGNDFLNRTQKTQKLGDRIDKWDYMKLKQKKWSLNQRGCPQNGRKCLPAIYLTRD